MSGLTRFLILSSLWLTALADWPTGEFHLRNGARLRGTMENVEEPSIRFRPQWARDPLLIKLSDVEMFVRRPPPPPPPLSPPHQVVFHSGDELGGRLVSISGRELTVESAWGAVFEIDLRQVREIRMRPPTAAVLVDHAGRVTFEGSNLWHGGARDPRMERIGSEVFRFDDLPGQFSFQLPPVRGSFEIDFRFRQERNVGNYELSFFTSRPVQRQGPGSMTFVHMGEQLRITQHPQGQNLLIMGQPQWQGPRVTSASRIQHLRMVYDHPRRMMRLWHNGHLVHSWPHTLSAGDFQAASDTWLGLRTQESPLLPLVVDRLEMLGFPGGPPAELRDPPEGASVAMSLRNADSLDGKSLVLEEGIFILTPPVGEPFTVSIGLVSGIRFAGRPRLLPAPAAEVRMGGSRSRLGLSRFQMLEEGLLAESPHWRGAKLLPWPQIDLIAFSE